MALVMVGQSEDGFQISQSPPAIFARQLPKAFGNTAIESLQPGRTRAGQFVTIQLNFHIRWLRVIYHWRKRAAMPVMTGDEMQDQIPITLGLLRQCFYAFMVLNQTDRQHFMARTFRSVW